MAIHALVLKGGQCAVLPRTAQILSLSLSGEISASSSCNNLPDPTEFICYSFFWENDDAGSMQDAYFVTLDIGGNVYNVPTFYNGLNATSNTLGDWISADPNLQGWVVLECQDHSPDHEMVISIPSGLPAPILKIANPYGSTTAFVYMHGVISEACDCP